MLPRARPWFAGIAIILVVAVAIVLLAAAINLWSDMHDLARLSHQAAKGDQRQPPAVVKWTA